MSLTRPTLLAAALARERRCAYRARKLDYLVDAYKQTLRLAGFDHSLAFEIKDEGGHELWLLFATSSVKGVAKMKEAMWAVDPVHGVRYRDPRDPDQMLLEIETTPYAVPAERILLARLANGGQTLDEPRVWANLEDRLQEGPGAGRRTNPDQQRAHRQAARPPRGHDPACSVPRDGRAGRRSPALLSLTTTRFVPTVLPRPCPARGGCELEVLGYFDLEWVADSTVRFSVFDVDIRDEDDDTDTTTVPFQVAYAVGIHKAQGLEYDTVKIVITSANEDDITHNIIYTAITRARRQLRIYWSPETQQAVISGLHATDTSKDVALLSTRRGLTPVRRR